MKEMIPGTTYKASDHVRFKHQYTVQIYLYGYSNPINVRVPEDSFEGDSPTETIPIISSYCWSVLRRLGKESMVGELIVDRWTWNEYTSMINALPTFEGYINNLNIPRLN